MKKQILFNLILVFSVIHCIFLLWSGIKVMTQDVDTSTGAIGPFRKFFGSILLLSGVAIGYSSLQLSRKEFAIPFIVLGASGILLFFFAGWIPSIISFSLAGAVKALEIDF